MRQCERGGTGYREGCCLFWTLGANQAGKAAIIGWRDVLAPAQQEVLEARAGARGLFQLCVFRLGFLEDGDVGVGIFPECEEILIGGAGFGEGVL